ncbi:hypothetical protein [Pantoea sp. SS70]|uniref:hypothetical protein n=1 Tax=Pantoea sp. SS70 TaxID=3024247 RepID=UPI002453276F|nr:hypothetical protein [Pantoea sp. SS70]WGK57177.1 hypothetical protein PO881_19080 [Pantoea sp. SS70]
MKIEIFVSDENHMANLGEQLHYIFNYHEIEVLEDNMANREKVLLLSQYLVGNVEDPLYFIKSKTYKEQFEIFETWCSLIKCPEELSRLCLTIFKFYY